MLCLEAEKMFGHDNYETENNESLVYFPQAQLCMANLKTTYKQLV